jgi:large repetitive protein
LLNKEVKVILDLVRMKGNAARSKIVSILITTVISGLLVSIPVPANAAACIPDSTTAGGDRVLTFSTVGNCDWEVPAGVTSVRVLVVGGGSSGGAGQAAVWWPQGGGGGAVVENTNFSITSSTIAVSVGDGGAAINTQGASSTSVNNGGQSRFGAITANGGTAPNNTLAPGGTSGNGNLGGNSTGQYVSGGGGGAGGAGNGTTGGVGVNSNISGTTVMYGSGGAGSSTNTGSASSGGGSNDNPPSANRGGGGSQPTGSSGLASAGAAGVVIIRFATPVTCNPTSTIVGSDIALTFTTVGSCDWTTPVGVSTADVLVVGGGGAGGTTSNGAGGGGGGGQVNAQSGVSISGVIAIRIGAGGVAQTVASATAGGNGGTSSFTRISESVISANGGSGGASVAVNAVGSPSTTGYNGGGGSVWAGSLSTTNGSNGVGGNKGGASVGSSSTADAQAGGGGGGSGGNGSNAQTSGSTTNGGAGGVGVSNSYIGSATFYGGGGGGGKRNASTGTAGSGGSGGGGAGGKVANGADATANTGGGGGGAGGEFVGGDGGSGVVIVRFSSPANTSLITFNSNGTADSNYFIYQATGVSGNLPARTTLLRTGFEFLGWNTSANGSGTSYALGGAITVSTDTTLYAQWSRITNPTCAANVGKGGIQSTTLASTKAGNGCVAISFAASGVNSTVTFNYTGANQSWTVPTGVTSATFYLFGAGGGGNSRTSGGGGGYATGAYSVTAGQVYTIIVGEGGGGDVAVTVTGLTGKYTKITYGGGGRGGSTEFDTYIRTFSSGGGRSAIRAPGASTDLATAGGGGGGGYGVCGFGGGGLSGVGQRGGTQTAGGASASLYLSGAAGNGSAYRGGDSNNEGGGGGGGYFGGGDGGDNNGGGGGSSYIALLTNGATSSGSNCSGALAETVGIGNIITYNANSATSGTVPNEAIVPGGTALTASTNTGTLARTNYTFSGWNTAANGSGTTYAVGSTTFIPTANTTLYAQWNTTITYNANGATAGTAPTATTAKGDAANTTLASRGTLDRTNFNFSGWNTLANGTGTFYAAGATNYQSTGNVTLYAQWTAPTGTPTLDSGSDTGSSTTDKLTKDNTPTINVGALVPGATVTITATPASGTPITCTFTAGAAVSPATTSSGSCTFTTLPDATYSFTVSQSYNGGASTASTALAGVVIDTARPTVTLTSTAILSGGNSLATPAAPSQNYNINAIFSKTVSGFVIGEITKNAESTGWEITTTALSTSALSSYTFNVRNATGAGNAAGKLYLSIAEGVATDAAGNTNVATTSDFIINTVIQLTLTNQYQAGINPVVGGNNATVVQSSNGASVDLTGQGGVTRANHTFAGWSLVTTNGSGTVIQSPYTPTVPLFLYSSWVANVYVVSYNANGGNGAPAATSQNFSFGGTALVPSALGTLSRTGYTFAGWSTASVASGTIYSNPADTVVGTTTKTYTPTASITLYAKWNPNNYTVTLDRNGATGTAINGIAIVAGTAKSLSGFSYTRDGYTLLGWNSLANGNGTSYAVGSSVTFYADTTLYANWGPRVPGVPTVAISGTAGNTQITVAVTGAALSGTVGPASSYVVTATPGSTTCTITAPATTCQFNGLTNGTAYTFKAVATNATGSSAASAASASATPGPYLVTYAGNSGTVSPTSANFNLGSPLTLPLPTRSGYNFTGWNNPSGTSVGLNGASYSPSAAVTLTAQWSAIVYTISYNGNGNTGGTAPSTGNYSTGGSSYSISSEGDLVKSGYSFNGWTTNSDGTGSAYSSGTGYTSSANLVLYAKWTPQIYTITYDKNGASGAPSRSTDSFTFGTTPLTLPTITGMTYANYTFGGWSETATGTAVISPYSPTQTRTLYAIWTGIQYSVSYNVNGGTGSVAEAVYTTGATGLTLSDGTGLTRAGYNFGGWKNLAGTTVSGSPYIATENVTLYAIWTPISVGISFNAGLVAGRAPTVTLPANTTAQFSTLYTLPAALASVTDGATPTPATYVFAGWEFAGSIYQAGSTYRMTTSAPVFTAQWQKLLAVRYVLNGGTLAAGDFVHDTQCTFEPVGFQCGGTNLVIDLNKRPVRTGFTFTGWSSQGTPATLVAEEASYTLNDSNFIFYANWTPNSYRITYAVGTGATSSAATAQTGNFGDIVTLASGANYTLSGSIFSGWLITSNLAAGALYTLGTDAGTLTAGTYELTATAQYANNTFKVFYNTNGSTAGNTPAATVAASGAAINLDSATGFSRSGFTFDGWSDGTTNLAAGLPTTMGSANSTLIAQWKVAIPVTPTISSVSGSDGGATVTVAAGSGGGAPASYTVTSSPTGGSCTITAPATSCSVSPLTNGTAYTFSVTATNATGTSAAATSAAITPAGKPDAPTGVTATVGNGSATVSFVAPASTGGPAITGYTITSSPAGATCTVGANATTYSCTGLTNGTAYTFAVVANNGIATSDASTSSLAVTPATVPGAPTSVTATSSASGVATVSFTAPASNGSAITGYTVTSSPAGATCTVGANATTYSCSGLTDGTSYTFSVVATNSIGNSSAAAAAAVTPQGAASAVTTISAVAGDGSAVITFSGATTNGSTITSYTVQAYDSSGSAVSGATCTATTSATNGSCTITGLTNGSQYTFKAVTNSTANSSAVSSVASIATTTVTPAKAPEAPTGITTTAGTGKVTVGWTEPADNGSAITSYTVQAYDNAGNAVAGATCTATAPATTCDVSANLAAGSAYTFKVTATSAAGTSAASTASTSASVNAAPSEPRNVTAVKGNTTATVSWDAPLDSRGSDVTGYTVTAYTSGNVAAGTCTSVAPTETCVVTGLTNGTPYTFKVTATNGIGTSAQSTASSAATPSTVPNAPTGVTVASGDAQVTVSFTAPTNNGGSSITGYTVTASDGSTISGTTSPLTITGLTNGTAYTFTVKATNINGDSVASSASASVTPVASSIPVLVTPGQPTGNPYVGSTLTSNVVFSGSPTPTQTYQWKVCESQTDLSSCTNISGATSASYIPTISELGKYIVVVATATNRVGSVTETSNPTLVIQPEIDLVAPSPVPGATAGTAYVLSLAAVGGVGAFAYTVSNGSLPAGLTLDPLTGQLAGTPTTAGTYTFTVRATDSNGVFKDVVVTLVVAAATVTPAPTPTPSPTPTPTPPAETCDSACQSARDASATKAAADKAAADAIAKAAADKAAADAAAAAKANSDAAAATASTKATADAAAAAAAAKAAVERAADAASAKAAADKASADAAARAKAASDAQAAANKAAAAAAAALKNSAASASAKAAATAAANKAAADATAAVKAAATAAQQAATAKNTAANANKQVEIAINSLNSKTAASQASAQANAIAAAAKAAANEAAAAAETRAAEAKAAATAAQRSASTTAARIATEQKEAATAAALAKVAADAAAKATAEKIATANAAKVASEALSKVLEEKAALAQQAAKTSDEAVRSEIAKKLEEIEVKAVEAERIAEEATADAEEAVEEFEAAVEDATEAKEIAETQAEEAVAVKAESATKTAAATKAVAAATVAAKVAAAAKAAAAKVPSKAVITKKPSTTSKNGAKATVTGLKPGQKVKVTVNVKPKP